MRRLAKKIMYIVAPASVATSALALMTSTAQQVERYLPISPMVENLKSYLPILQSIETPILVAAAALVLVWIILSCISSLIKRHAGIILLVIVAIAIPVYLNSGITL